MNVNNLQSLSAPLLNRNQDVQQAQPQRALRSDNHAPAAGHVGLAGRMISNGDGEKRNTTVTCGDQAKSAFKTAGKGLGALIAAPIALGLGVAAATVWLTIKTINFIPRMINNHILEPRAEAAFKATNAAMIGALATPMKNSVLTDPRVIDKLVAHAEAAGRPVSKAEITALVSSGERISQALYAPGGDARPLKVVVDGQSHDVKAGTHSARACSWFMMAQAAKQDLNRADLGGVGPTSDMVTAGSFIMKDPGNRMYNFLNSAPTASSRMSSHFEERLDAQTGKHQLMGFIPTSKLSHHGIEDYQNKMPGSGGTMLFNRLAPGAHGAAELYVKFEHGGCPPYFKTESHEGLGHGITRFFAALDRNLDHSVDFVRTRFSGPSATDVVRQEHVYKGALKQPINDGFSKLIKSAINAGVIHADSSAVGKSVGKFGLPFVQNAIAAIQNHAQTHAAAGHDTAGAVANQANALAAVVAQETGRLGLASDVHGIQRRGAEVHIDIATVP